MCSLILSVIVVVYVWIYEEIVNAWPLDNDDDEF